jgi:hypothetical protein
MNPLSPNPLKKAMSDEELLKIQEETAFLMSPVTHRSAPGLQHLRGGLRLAPPGFRTGAPLQGTPSPGLRPTD